MTNRTELLSVAARGTGSAPVHLIEVGAGSLHCRLAESEPAKWLNILRMRPVNTALRVYLVISVKLHVAIHTVLRHLYLLALWPESRPADGASQSRTYVIDI